MASDSPSDGMLTSLDGKYKLSLSLALPDYDSPQAPAYHVSSTNAAQGRLMALVCDPHMPLNEMEIDGLRKRGIPGLLELTDVTHFEWRDRRSRRVALIMQRPGGARVMPAMQERIDPIDDLVIKRQILPALMTPLRELHSRGQAHRAIRPTNLFYTSPGGGAVVLGENLTAPPGYNQPDFLEPIESAQADPSGRDGLALADDMFALGGTILTLLLGRDPTAEVGAEELMRLRIEATSFNAIAGSYELPPTIVDLMRGLLNDNPKDRWSFGEIEQWLIGKRPPSRAHGAARKSERGFKVGEHECFTAPALANAMATDWDAGLATLRNNKFEEWCRRSLGDRERVAAVEKVMKMRGSPSGSEDALLSQLLIALDPQGPIRYRSVAVFPGGLGRSLALAPEGNERRQHLLQVVRGRLALHWFASRAVKAAQDRLLGNMLENLVQVLAKGTPGQGAERLLYELNPGYPCVSPIVDRLRPTTVREVVEALEAVSRDHGRARSPIDRHVAAFLGARFKDADASWLNGLSESDGSAGGAFAILAVLARLQRATQLAQLPGLAEWVASLMQPAILAFKNRKKQAEVRAEMERLAKQGSLVGMAQALGDATQLERDRREFNAAEAHYLRVAKEIADTERRINDRDRVAASHGGAIALVISILAGVGGAVFLSRLLIS
jgi:hypothetical protein